MQHSNRGLAAQQLAVAILERARHRQAHHDDARRHNGPLGTIRRKYLIQRNRLQAARFGLQEELAGFVYAAGCEALTGLDLAQLESLDSWLDDLVARVDTACDPPLAPPAR